MGIAARTTTVAVSHLFCGPIVRLQGVGHTGSQRYESCTRTSIASISGPNHQKTAKCQDSLYGDAQRVRPYRTLGPAWQPGSVRRQTTRWCPAAATQPRSTTSDTTPPSTRPRAIPRYLNVTVSWGPPATRDGLTVQDQLQSGRLNKRSSQAAIENEITTRCVSGSQEQ